LSEVLEFLYLREGLGSPIKYSQNDKKAGGVQINLATVDESPMDREGAGSNNLVFAESREMRTGSRVRLGATAADLKTT
jgi:hypothetical protein